MLTEQNCLDWYISELECNFCFSFVLCSWKTFSVSYEGASFLLFDGEWVILSESVNSMLVILSLCFNVLKMK